MTVTLERANGETSEVTVLGGQLPRLPLAQGDTARLIARPAKNLDLGEGKGKPIERTVEGGIVGLLLDGRGRPLQLPEDDTARQRKLSEWLVSVGAMNS